MARGTVYNWQDISDAPAKSGVYAWYYSPEISTRDLNNIVADVTVLKASGESAAAKEAIKRFLDDNIFQYFREQPFTARLRGALKPQYYGLIEHLPSLSESLLDRLVDNPARLFTMKEILESSAPEFASPIYIGMAENLRSRLRQHKALIERYSERITPELSDEAQRDQSFAREIVNRNIPPARLFVTTKVVTGPLGTYVDIENVLNRIHYPLLGRN